MKHCFWVEVAHAESCDTSACYRLLPLPDSPLPACHVPLLVPLTYSKILVNLLTLTTCCPQSAKLCAQVFCTVWCFCDWGFQHLTFVWQLQFTSTLCVCCPAWCRNNSWEKPLRAQGVWVQVRWHGWLLPGHRPVRSFWWGVSSSEDPRSWRVCGLQSSQRLLHCSRGERRLCNCSGVLVILPPLCDFDCQPSSPKFWISHSAERKSPATADWEEIAKEAILRSLWSLGAPNWPEQQQAVGISAGSLRSTGMAGKAWLSLAFAAKTQAQGGCVVRRRWNSPANPGRTFSLTRHYML